MHEITVPGLPFEKEGVVLEDRWKKQDNGKVERFMAYMHDDERVVLMISGIRYPDGNVRILNTATREEYRHHGLLSEIIGNFIKEQDEHINVMASLSTKVSKEQITDEEMNKINEFLKDKTDIFEIYGYLQKSLGSEVPFREKDNFQMLGKLYSKIQQSTNTTFELAKGGSEINLIAKFPVTIELRKK